MPVQSLGLPGQTGDNGGNPGGGGFPGGGGGVHVAEADRGVVEEAREAAQDEGGAGGPGQKRRAVG